MRFYRFIIIVVCILGIQLTGHAQLKIQTGEHFMAGISIEKLHVCVEDHSVWALTPDGKVYHKKTSDQDFSIYPLTAALTVKSVTGFNANEMYFVADNKVLLIKNGIVEVITISFPGVTRINEISVVYGKSNVTSANPGVNNKDYLAIATNKSFYYAIRGNNAATLEHIYTNHPYVAEPEGRFTYTGFKGLDLYYFNPSMLYCIDADHLAENINRGYSVVAYLPDKGAYNKVNATIFARNFYFPSKIVSFQDYDIWGSTNGLFIKTIGTCANLVIKQRLANEYINDIEEVYALTPIYKQDYLIAASNTGIYYTPQNIFSKIHNDPDFATFVKLNDFPAQKVTAVSTETDYLGVYINNQDKYYSICERVVWASTESGVYKLYLSLDQDYFNDFKWAEFYYSKSPSSGSLEEPTFETCGNEEVTITTKIPATFANQILIKWYKDEVEVPSSIGQLQMTFKDSGIYKVKITSLCENITVTSNPITINHNTGPELTFSYPSEVKICSGHSFSFETNAVNGYNYRWYKDNVLINGASSNTYLAKTNGSYRVEVSNCTGIYETSTATKLIVLEFQKPIITAGKNNYCTGETATLSVANPLNYRTKWYSDNIELPLFANENEISTNNAGRYRVEFINELDCVISSAVFQLTTTPLVQPVIETDKTSYCIGDKPMLSISNPHNYEIKWFLNGTELPAEMNKNAVKVTDAGIYSATFSNGLGCSSVSANFNLTFNAISKPVIFKNINRSLCYGESVKLSVEKASTYLWSTGETTQDIVVSSPGSYWVKITNASKCESISDPVQITMDPEIKLTEASYKVCMIQHEKITLMADKGFLYYTWNGIKGTTSTLEVDRPGVYTLVVEDANGCTANINYQVVPACDQVITVNTFSPNGDGINDLWIVYGLENDPNARISIYNRLGALVFETYGKQPSWDGTSRGNAAPVGTYYYVITTINSDKPIKGSITLIR